MLEWPGTHENYRKIPTCLVYAIGTDHEHHVIDYIPVKWGVEAKTHVLREGEYR